MKSMYKSDLADAAGVSRTTFWRWLKENNSQLAQFGVTPKSTMLPPRAVNWVCAQYGIDL